MAATAGRGGCCWRVLIRSLQSSARCVDRPSPLPAAARGFLDSAVSSSREPRPAFAQGLQGRACMYVGKQWQVAGNGVRWMGTGQLPGGQRPVGREEEEENVEENAAESGTSTALTLDEASLQSQILSAPRRKRRFLFEQALKIRPPSTPGWSPNRMEMKVIDVNRTCKVTKGGGIMNFTAFVICGNNKGVVGFGKGKSTEVASAVDKAYLRASNNLHYFERYHGHTIHRKHDTKYGKTKIYLWPAKPGTGMRASHTVGGILRLAGFKDVKTKVVGSRHPHNTVKAVFKALSEIEVPEGDGGLELLKTVSEGLPPRRSFQFAERQA